MNFSSVLRANYQLRTRVDENDYHSILISLLRGMAAIVVATSHLRAAVYPSFRAVSDPPFWFNLLAFICGFSHQAVLIFFVISGWLVGGSLLNRMQERHAITNYTIDRITRLWTVLIPTLLLTLLIGIAIGTADPGELGFSLAHPYSASAFVGNLIGLQGVFVPNYGENFALWSLANETWYYLLFPLLAIALFGRGTFARLACLATLVFLCFMLPASIAGYFFIWLLGVAFSRFRIECGNGIRWLWVALTLMVSVYFRLTGELDAFEMSTLGQDVLCSVFYLALLSSLQFRTSPQAHFVSLLRKGGGFFAEFSFTLYVLHVPLIGLFCHLGEVQLGLRVLSPSDATHTGIFFGMLTVLLVSAYLSYLLFESKTCRVRNVVKNLAKRYRESRSGQATVSTKG